MRHIIYKLAGATTAAAMWTLGAAAAGGHANVRSDPAVDHQQMVQYQQSDHPARYEQPKNNQQPKNYEQPKHEQYTQPKHVEYTQPKHDENTKPKHEEYSQPKHENYTQPKHEDYKAPVRHEESKPAPRHDEYQSAPKHEYDQPKHEPKHDYDRDKHDVKPVNVHHDYDRDRHDYDKDKHDSYNRDNDRHINYTKHDDHDKYRHHGKDRHDYDKDRHDYDKDRHDYDRHHHDYGRGSDFRHVVIIQRDDCDFRHNVTWSRADWMRYDNKDRCDYKDRHHDRHDYDRVHHDYDRDNHLGRGAGFRHVVFLHRSDCDVHHDNWTRVDWGRYENKDRCEYINRHHDRHDYDRVHHDYGRGSDFRHVNYRNDCDRYDRDMHHVNYLHHKHNGRGHDWDNDSHMRTVHYTHHGQLRNDCGRTFGDVRFQAKLNELRLASFNYVNSHRMNLRDDCRCDWRPVHHTSCNMRSDRDHYMHMRA